MSTITCNDDVLADKGMNFVDMHHHSNASDGNSTPELIAKAAMKKGFGVCIADHNQIKGSAYLSKKKGLFTIPCVEVTTRDSKDVLAYFYDSGDLISFWEKEIKGRIIKKSGIFNFHPTSLGVLELLEKIKEYNGISALPHPFAVMKKKSYKLLNDKAIAGKIDVIESHNFLLGKYSRCLKLAKSVGKPVIGGSDSHTITNFRVLTGSTEFERDAFLDSILKKKNMIYFRKGFSLKWLVDDIAVLKNNLF